MTAKMGENEKKKNNMNTGQKGTYQKKRGNFKWNISNSGGCGSGDGGGEAAAVALV
jgi:hypothetical protein